MFYVFSYELAGLMGVHNIGLSVQIKPEIVLLLKNNFRVFGHHCPFYLAMTSAWYFDGPLVAQVSLKIQVFYYKLKSVRNSQKL